MRIPNTITAIIAVNLVFLGQAAILADDVEIVPEAEKAIARKIGVSGPTETHGVESSEILGSIELGHDFEALEGRSLRARKVALAPGGVVGVHRHTTRPGVLYMLEGELTEFRNDHDGALTRRQGETSFEKDGVIHWWRNDSSKIAIALVVDIVPNDQT